MTPQNEPSFHASQESLMPEIYVLNEEDPYEMMVIGHEVRRTGYLASASHLI